MSLSTDASFTLLQRICATHAETARVGDEYLAGDFGFDPLLLADTPKKLLWYREAEMKHARLAMLAVKPPHPRRATRSSANPCAFEGHPTTLTPCGP